MSFDELSHATPEQSLRIILDGITSLRNGDFNPRLPQELPADAGRIAKVFNELLDLLVVLGSEHHRLMEELGVTGRLGGQMQVPEPTGAWRQIVDGVNLLGQNMTWQQRVTGRVILEHLRGETQSRLPPSAIGAEILEIRDMLDELLARFSAAKAES